MFFWCSRDIFISMQALVIAYVKLFENKPLETESIEKEIQPFHFRMHSRLSHILYIAP